MTAQERLSEHLEKRFVEFTHIDILQYLVRRNSDIVVKNCERKLKRVTKTTKDKDKYITVNAEELAVLRKLGLA
jgi:hypothetical protein